MRGRVLVTMAIGCVGCASSAARAEFVLEPFGAGGPVAGPRLAWPGLGTDGWDVGAAGPMFGASQGLLTTAGRTSSQVGVRVRFASAGHVQFDYAQANPAWPEASVPGRLDVFVNGAWAWSFEGVAMAATGPSIPFGAGELEVVFRHTRTAGGGPAAQGTIAGIDNLRFVTAAPAPGAAGALLLAAAWAARRRRAG